MSDHIESYEERLVQTAHCLQQRVQCMPQDFLTEKMRRSPSGEHVWTLNEESAEVIQFATQVIFGELFVCLPKTKKGAVKIHVREQNDGRPLHNSDYQIPAYSSGGENKVIVTVENQHNSIVPLSQINYWLSTLLTVFESSPEIPETV